MNFKKLRRAVLVVARALTIPDRSPRLPEAPLILYSCHDVDRSMTADGKRFSPLLEGIRIICHDLGYRAMNLTHPFAITSGRTVKGDSVTLNYRTLVHRIRARIGGGEATRIAFEAAYYRNLLHRSKPALVLSIQPPHGLCLAARELGIPIAEALHGTSYMYGDPVFEPIFAKPDKLLSNVMLAFDDITLATIERYFKGRDVAVQRANDPWAHAMRLESARTGQPGENRQTERRKRVLVTLQWGYDGERDSLSGIIPNGVIHPALESAFEMPNVEFLIRAHPIQMNRPGYRRHRRYVKSLPARFANVEWERPTSRPLPLLLDEVDAHITMSSSTVGEAAEAGVPSLTLCPTLREGGSHFGLFREWGNFVTFGSLDTGAISGWIASLPLRNRDELRDPEADHLKQMAFYSTLLPPLGSGSPNESAQHQPAGGVDSH